jgi:hypothetical protein
VLRACLVAAAISCRLAQPTAPALKPRQAQIKPTSCQNAAMTTGLRIRIAHINALIVQLISSHVAAMSHPLRGLRRHRARLRLGRLAACTTLLLQWHLLHQGQPLFGTVDVKRISFSPSPIHPTKISKCSHKTAQKNSTVCPVLSPF